MDITETYDDMIDASVHVSGRNDTFRWRLKLWVYEFNEELQTYYES